MMGWGPSAIARRYVYIYVKQSPEFTNGLVQTQSPCHHQRIDPNSQQ